MSLRNAFNAILQKGPRRLVTLKDMDSGATVTNFQIVKSNFARQTQGPSETVIPGREWVVTKTDLEKENWTLERGHRFIDPEMGTMTIIDIDEMCDLGGAIMGYRVKTN